MKAKQNSAVHNFLTKFATIFTPLIPGFIAAGLLLGIATLMQQTLIVEGVAPAAWLKGLIAYMKVFSIGLFTFLSILIGFNTQKAFGGTGVNGAIIASLFVLRYVPEGTTGYYAGMSDFLGWRSTHAVTLLGFYWPVSWAHGSKGRCAGSSPIIWI